MEDKDEKRDENKQDEPQGDKQDEPQGEKQDQAPEEKQQKLKVICPSCKQKLDVTGLESFSKIACPACTGEVIVPRRFGDLFLEEPIGKGGMAHVYRALELTLDREVAVKILNEKIVRNPNWVRLFLNEARSAAAVNHPNVVPIYSCGEHEKQPYLIMQFMGGLSLDRQIRKHSAAVPIELCFKVALSSARGLDAAHRHGIVHHDVKPGNILMDHDGNIKISDFGLAQIVRDDSAPSVEDLTKSWSSTYYVSPEKVKSGKEDYRGDIYSLGATLYHTITGQPPFPGEDAKSVARARLEGSVPELPDKLRPETPTALADLVMRMMNPDLGERPQSYEAVISGLEEVQKGGKKKQFFVGRKPEGNVLPTIGPEKRVTPAADAQPSADAAPARVFRASVRRRRRRRRIRPFDALVNVCLLASIAMLAVVCLQIVRRRPPWYVKSLEPRVRQLLKLPPIEPDQAVAPPAPAPGVQPQQPPVQPQQPGVQPQQPAPAVPGAPGQPQPQPPGQLAPPAPGVQPAPPPPVPGQPAAQPPAGPVQPAAVQPAPVPGGGGPGGGGSRVPPEVAAARPQPADLNFFAVKAQLQEYVKQAPADLREGERERIREISPSRTYLIKLMKYVPYDVESGGVMLRNGIVLEGSVPLCNENELIVRMRDEKANSEKLKWDEIAFEQYVAFFEFYINMRLKQGMKTGSGASGAESRKEASADCVRLAVLCDWYGRPSLAEKYAGLARGYNPACQARLELLLPGCDTPAAVGP